jgi:hypothetical protein
MASKEIYLSISDVEETLSAFEKKYKVSSIAFMSDPGVRESLPEDEVSEWTAFIDHKNELQELDQELHREYLQNLIPPSDQDSNVPKALSKLALAA